MEHKTVLFLLLPPPFFPFVLKAQEFVCQVYPLVLCCESCSVVYLGTILKVYAPCIFFLEMHLQLAFAFLFIARLELHIFFLVVSIKNKKRLLR